MDRPYGTIACCIERDDVAKVVLREGARLAGGALVALRVVHVIPPPQPLMTNPYGYVAPSMELRSDATAWLAEVAREVGEATPVLLEGFPATEVCAWARSSGVDLIVAAAHRGLLQRAMLGGFASYVAYHAPCPVLLVHPPAKPPPASGSGEATAAEIA